MAKRSSNDIQKTCIFCGKTPLSKEHIWPDWAGSLLPGSGGYRTEHFLQRHRTRTTLQQTHNQRPGHTKSSRIRNVCKPCNNEWMKTIEEAAKPILEPMIKGETVVLKEREQTTLATWITLKMIVTETHMNKAPIAPVADRQNFMSDPAPLRDMKIYISSCNDHRWQTAFFNASIYLSTDPRKNGPDNSQSFTIGIGRLFAHACHSIAPGVDFGLQGDNGAIVRQLWPIVDRPMFWPPLRSLSYQEASDIASSVERFLYAFHANEPRPAPKLSIVPGL